MEINNLSKLERHNLNNHKSFVLWFTGLSGAGKSTLANSLENKLYDHGIRTYILDGDNIRKGLNKDLGFSDDARVENIRRIGEVSKLFVDAGAVTLVAFISPFIADRKIARELVEKDEFIEIFVDCSLEVCESRDVKGLYKKARSGELKMFTGIDSAYEKPVNPELIIDTANKSIEQCVEQIYNYLSTKGLIK
ncbi:MAG: adenylyl-sulfate kinase [Candidatus Sericytochromatia bacterium]|nr:adenylyl-sulfate kinase [Candidatus Sericytochromatia bacterium]